MQINSLIINKENFVLVNNVGKSNENFKAFQKAHVTRCAWLNSVKEIAITVGTGTERLSIVLSDVSKADALVASEALQSEKTHDFTVGNDEDEDEESDSDEDVKDNKPKTSTAKDTPPLPTEPIKLGAPGTIAGSDA